MSFWWIWGIYFMDHVVLRNDFGMDKKLSAVSGGLGIVRVMAAAWLISVMISAVGMVLASLIFYAVGEGQNRIRVSVYVVVVLAVLIGGIYAGHRIGYRRFLWGAGAGSYILCHTLPDFSGIRMYGCRRVAVLSAFCVALPGQRDVGRNAWISGF